MPRSATKIVLAKGKTTANLAGFPEYIGNPFGLVRAFHFSLLDATAGVDSLSITQYADLETLCFSFESLILLEHTL